MEIKLELIRPDDVCVNIGKLVRLARQREEFTQVELSKRSGVAATTISRMERDGQVGLEAVARVLFALDQLDALDVFLKERIRLAGIPKHLTEEPTFRKIIRVRHRKGKE